MENKKNLILFIVISAIIFGAWQFLYVIPYQAKQEALQKQQQAAQQAANPTPSTSAAQGSAGNTAGTVAPGAAGQPLELKSRPEALAASTRVTIDTPHLSGSIALKGGRLDDLVLKGYPDTVEPNSPDVALLSPTGAAHAYFAEVGFVPGGGNVAAPGPDTVWNSDGGTLSPGHAVTLSWDNGAGLLFKRAFSVDENYMFSVTQSVENKGAQPVVLVPYSRVVRFGLPKDFTSGVVHEGAIGALGDPDPTLHGTGMFSNPWSYAAIKKQGQNNTGDAAVIKESTKGGWIGITDKFWLVAQIMPSDEKGTARVFYDPKYDSYQTDFTGTALTVAPDASASDTTKIFAGVKEASLLSTYRDTQNIPLFERAIDFGVYWFMTEPLQWFLTKVYHAVGNFGLAILCLTILVKLALFPLANKSYSSMSKMKTLQPKMAELKEKYGDDKARINTEMMALYKREKVNPAAGCLPMFVQIPVFYSLYKLFNITIEMRHAPFFGWIHDLSSPDPTTVLNLFGLIPWHPAEVAAHLVSMGGTAALIATPITFLSIGIWPLIMGFTMWAQMRLNPTPPDPVQARMFQVMPVIFTFMLAHFAAGLVIYWAWNNTLSILQQRYIMRKLDKAKEQHKEKKA
jgi:YidC/Oxa1 family membrane protein insertase